MGKALTAMVLSAAVVLCGCVTIQSVGDSVEFGPDSPDGLVMFKTSVYLEGRRGRGPESMEFGIGQFIADWPVRGVDKPIEKYALDGELCTLPTDPQCGAPGTPDWYDMPCRLAAHEKHIDDCLAAMDYTVLRLPPGRYFLYQLQYFQNARDGRLTRTTYTFLPRRPDEKGRSLAFDVERGRFYYLGELSFRYLNLKMRNNFEAARKYAERFKNISVPLQPNFIGRSRSQP